MTYRMNRELTELRKVAARLERDTERRNALIRAASEAGASRRRVAAAARLSFARIQQIVSGSVLILLLCAPLAFGADPAQDEWQWGQRHWANPTTIHVIDYAADRADTPTFWRRVRDDALAKWEKSGVVHFRVTERSGAACAGYSRRKFDQAKRSFPDGAMSLCRLQGGNPMIAGWTVAPHAADGAIKKAVVAVRSANTLCHEIGHAIGLDHPPIAYEDDSCVGIGDWRRPGAMDLEQLRAIYG